MSTNFRTIQHISGLNKNGQLILGQYMVRTLQEAYVLLEKSIFLYNYKRPHLSCDMLSPNEAYSEFGPLERRWKNYYDPSKRKEKK